MTVDLTKRRFGKLTAISPTKDRYHGLVVWRCVCDCGRMCFIPSRWLWDGSCQSCGCEFAGGGSSLGPDITGHHRGTFQQHDITGDARGAFQGPDITDHRRGKLTAIAPTGMRYTAGIAWAWRCDCGRLVYKPDSQVTDSAMCARCARENKQPKAHKEPKDTIEPQKEANTPPGMVENMLTGKLTKRNSSGVRGVVWDRNANKWKARLNGKYLGLFKTIEEAAEARKKAVEAKFADKNRDR